MKTIYLRSKQALFFLLVLSSGSYAQGTWLTYSKADSGLPNNEVSSIVEDTTGKIWIGTYNGLTRFDGKNWMKCDSLETNVITALSIDKKGNVLVGIWGSSKGLLQFDGARWSSCNAGRGFFVIDVIEVDKQGNKWVGSSGYDGGTGLAKFEGNTGTVYSSWNSKLPSNDIRALAIDSINIWLATYRNTGLGLTRFDGQEWKTFTTQNSSLPSNSITAISEDAKGTLWIGTEKNGIAYLKSGKWTNFDHKNSKLPNDSITMMTIDRKGNKWIGTNGGGLIKFNGTDYTSYTTSNSQLPNDCITAIRFDRSGRLWIGTKNGLALYTPEQ